MTDTTTKFEPGFWGQTHPLSAKQDELFNKLVPASGEASTAHGEVLRAATRIYYDVYNNGLCNGPFTEEAATLRRFESQLMSRMEHPDTFSGLLRAVAPRNVEYGNMRPIRDLSTWSYGPALEDLMAAVVTFVDQRVSALEAAGASGAAAVQLLPADHELADAEAKLAERHLQGKRAQTLAGELFCAMRSLATAIEVKGFLTPENHYELTLLAKFAQDLPVDAATANGVHSTLSYHLGSNINFPAMDQWTWKDAFERLGEAVVRYVTEEDAKAV
jgi:hypothetical protein